MSLERRQLPVGGGARRLLQRQGAVSGDLSDGPLDVCRLAPLMPDILPQSRLSGRSLPGTHHHRGPRVTPALGRLPRCPQPTPPAPGAQLKGILERYTRGLACYEQELLSRRQRRYHQQPDPQDETSNSAPTEEKTNDDDDDAAGSCQPAEGASPTSPGSEEGPRKQDLSDSPPFLEEGQQAPRLMTRKEESATGRPAADPSRRPKTSDLGSSAEDDEDVRGCYIQNGHLAAPPGPRMRGRAGSSGFFGDGTDRQISPPPSPSAQQKSAGFRRSKMSSGYGTSAGSEDKEEVEDLPSVFASEEASGEGGGRATDRQDHREATPAQAPSGGMPNGGASPLLDIGLADPFSCLGQSEASSGVRPLELRNSSLSSSARIWQFEINVPSHVRRAERELKSREPCDDLIVAVMRANPQIHCRPPVPDVDPRRELDEIETELQVAGHFASLSSAPWAECVQTSCEDSTGFSCSLQFSNSSSEDISGNGSGGVGGSEGRDPTDDPRPSNGYTGVGSHQTSGQLNRPHSSHSANGEPLPVMSGLMTDPHPQLGPAPGFSRRSSGTGCLRAKGIGVAEDGRRSAGDEARGGGDVAVTMAAASRQPHITNSHTVRDAVDGRKSARNEARGGGDVAVTMAAASRQPHITNSHTVRDAVDGRKSVRNEARGGGDVAVTMAATSWQPYIRNSHTVRDGADGRKSARNEARGGRDDAVDMATVSRQPLPYSCAGGSSKDRNSVRPNQYQGHGDDMRWFQRCLDSAIYCQNKKCIDFVCLKGKRHLLELEDLSQRDELRSAQGTLWFLWQHSLQCRERHCPVPFCCVFRQRWSWPFDVRPLQLASEFSQRALQQELVDFALRKLQLGKFFHLNPNDRLSHQTWQNARMVKQEFLGRFGDFNVLCGRLAFPGDHSLEVVIKKAVAHKEMKDVYYEIGKMALPYIAQSLWWSDEVTAGEPVLVCSLYYPDCLSLDNLTPDPSLTRNLTLLHQVVLATQYLHSSHIIYLNWKCSSLLWDGRTVKLCNFTKAVKIKEGNVTKCPDEIMASLDPKFTAPEVLCSEALGYFTDVWGIGCLFYELVSRSPPYPDYCHEPPDVIRELVCCRKDTHTYPEEGTYLCLLCRCWERVPAHRWTVPLLLETVKENLTNAER